MKKQHIVHPAARRIQFAMPYAGMTAQECATISYAARKRLDARLAAHKTADKMSRLATLSHALRGIM